MYAYTGRGLGTVGSVLLRVDTDLVVPVDRRYVR